MNNLIIVSLIAILLFLIFLAMVYLNRKNHEFSFFNSFPFELFGGKNPLRIYFLMVNSIMISAIGIVFIVFAFSCNRLICHVSVITLCFSLLSFLSLAFIDLHQTKAHLVLDVLLFMFSIMGHVLLATSVLEYADIMIINKYFCIYFYLVGFLQLLSLFNPNLSNCLSLTKVINSEGKEEFVRGKVALLPMYEWIFLFVFFLDVIILAIASIIG